MKRELRDQDCLEHLREAMVKIQRRMAHKAKAQFMADDVIQDAVIRNLEVIGEAAGKLSQKVKATYSDVPWNKISGMRNELIHGYVNVDLDIVWDTAVHEIPKLLKKLEAIQQTINLPDAQKTDPKIEDHKSVVRGLPKDPPTSSRD